MAVRGVFFDVGETLIDETRMWRLWADWLNVTYGTFFTVLGGVIARGGSHRDVFTHLTPGLDFETERRRKAAAGAGYRIEAGDFYPDALPCLHELRARGYLVGISGNQPEATEAALRALQVPVDVVASSAGWGVAKPSPAFFTRMASEAGLAPEELAYVGDRLDNDVLPAAAAGMVAVFIKRGPWGYLFTDHSDAQRAHILLDTLSDLPERLDRYAASP